MKPETVTKRAAEVEAVNAAAAKVRAACAELAEAYAATKAATVGSPADAHALLADMATFNQETLRVVLLNARNRVIDTRTVYVGSIDSTLVRVGEVFREAILQNAHAIIVAHNHPSGDPSPSPEDVALTRAMVEAGKLLDVAVLDHLIIAGTGFVSLKARGLGF
ncbi:MAG: hypothetical protein FJ125_08310 [Deltaproteobacteria bacterium]|nr:hypothetical protein [Deltaproteobacteria bacterium]